MSEGITGVTVPLLRLAQLWLDHEWSGTCVVREVVANEHDGTVTIMHEVRKPKEETHERNRSDG